MAAAPSLRQGRAVPATPPGPGARAEARPKAAVPPGYERLPGRWGGRAAVSHTNSITGTGAGRAKRSAASKAGISRVPGSSGARIAARKTSGGRGCGRDVQREGRLLLPVSHSTERGPKPPRWGAGCLVVTVVPRGKEKGNKPRKKEKSTIGLEGCLYHSPTRIHACCMNRDNGRTHRLLGEKKKKKTSGKQQRRGGLNSQTSLREDSGGGQKRILKKKKIVLPRESEGEEPSCCGGAGPKVNFREPDSRQQRWIYLDKTRVTQTLGARPDALHRQPK
ncbi:uncharacterized protein LOC110389813 [Numida meleagris]|uniref:uncharacterized protein LOC110389813 n=1 Tax=Numida meleagris TaxID=8996 RepID=UPI000B3DB800|nr:uncharacterized protein LOC110389813 [Numida meleagris]